MCEIFSILKNEYYRLCELEKVLSTHAVIKNKTEYIKLSTEYNILKKKLADYLLYKNIIQEINDVENIINNNKDDKDLCALALIELDLLKNKKIQFKNIIMSQNDSQNPEKTDKKESVFLELRSASGGNESAIFVEDLVKMYIAYTNKNEWNYSIINYTKGNISGYKDIIIKVEGKNTLYYLNHEAGIHRVQRVPTTEAHGKIQTSTCTVAVLPEIKDLENVELNPNDIRIDTFRASGAGGQHVNVTDSAVRIIHLATNIVVECQNERSQHKNKANAMEILKIKLLQKKNLENKSLLDDKRRDMVGSGDRSEKIRTYNFIKNRITDHRKNITIYRLKEILEGDLNLIISKLTQ